MVKQQIHGHGAVVGYLPEYPQIRYDIHRFTSSPSTEQPSSARLPVVEAMDRILSLAARQDFVVTAGQCRAAGLNPEQVKRLCRSRRWLWLHRGVYLVDADILGEPGRRTLVRAALFAVGPHAVAVLGTAAELHGLAGLRRDDTMHVSLPGPASRAKRVCDLALCTHQFSLPPQDVMSLDGMLVTTPTRTAADVILHVDRYAAVSLLDSGLNRGLLQRNDLAEVGRLISGRRGAAAARPWIAEADGRAESPLETRIRLRCVDGRVPPETLQHRVYDPDGHLLGIGDLAWGSDRLIAEGDGAQVHDLPEAVFRDRWRQNNLVNAGWRLVRFTWADTLKPPYIPQVVRAALGRPAA